MNWNEKYENIDKTNYIKIENNCTLEYMNVLFLVYLGIRNGTSYGHLDGLSSWGSNGLAKFHTLAVL